MYRRGNRRGNKKITTGYLKELSSINVSDGLKNQTSVETRRLHLDEDETLRNVDMKRFIQLSRGYFFVVLQVG